MGSAFIVVIAVAVVIGLLYVRWSCRKEPRIEDNTYEMLSQEFKKRNGKW